MRIFKLISLTAVVVTCAILAVLAVRHARFLAQGRLAEPSKGELLPAEPGAYIFATFGGFDDLAYDPNAPYESAALVDQHDGRVYFRVRAGAGESRSAPRDHAIALSELLPNTLVRAGGYRDIALFEHVDYEGHPHIRREDGRSLVEDTDGLEIVRAADVAQSTGSRFAGVFGLLVAGVLLLLTAPPTFGALFSDDDEKKAAVAAPVGGAPPPNRRPADVVVLLCPSCGVGVPLAAAPESRCRACGAAVPQPAAYQALVEERRALRDRLPSEVRALRRVALAAHPAMGWALKGLAAGVLLSSAGLIVSHYTNQSGASVWLRIWRECFAVPLFFAPLPLWLAGKMQRSGGTRFSAARAALGAHRDARGYLCRSCGGPLHGLVDGVAEVCGYCGAQNIVSEELAKQAQDAGAALKGVDLNIAWARREFRLGMWKRFGFALVGVVVVLAIWFWQVAVGNY